MGRWRPSANSAVHGPRRPVPSDIEASLENHARRVAVSLATPALAVENQFSDFFRRLFGAGSGYACFMRTYDQRTSTHIPGRMSPRS